MRTWTAVSAVALAMGVAVEAQAVHLDPHGRGQVLLYPYYTVNKHQQTLLTVNNTSSVAQAARVRFREAYNGRSVMEFNVFLAAYDSWTGTIFALDDASVSSNGAAILTGDTSCTTPQFSQSPTSINGTPYIAFTDTGYLSPLDGGPYTIDRTREGFIEVIVMSQVEGQLAADIAHGSNGTAPAGCGRLASLNGSEAGLWAPNAGLTGSASIINVGQGTLLSVRADALQAFTRRSLFAQPDSETPNLTDVNDGANDPLLHRATARFIDDGGVTQALTYPGPDPLSRRVDAVTAVLMAHAIYNDYSISAAIGAASDWVLTMPTKHFYTDAQWLASPTPIAPFTAKYDHGNPAAGERYSFEAFDRNARFYTPWRPCAGSATCFGTPPPLPAFRMLLLQTNVLSIRQQGGAAFQGISDVLGSTLARPVETPFGAGALRLDLRRDVRNQLLPSVEGKSLLGQPMIGFWASQIVNNQVSEGVLANYTAATPHQRTVVCADLVGVSLCDLATQALVDPQ